MQPVYTFVSEEDELRFKEIVFNEMMSEMHKERGIVKTGKQIREEVYNAYFKNKLVEWEKEAKASFFYASNNSLTI